MSGYFFLFLCVLSTNAIITGLKEAGRRNLDLLQTVSFNYLFAGLTGVVLAPGFAQTILVDHPDSLKIALPLGFSFVTLFFLMGIIVDRIGMAYMTIIAKLSLAIPVLWSWQHYQEPMTETKWLGILLAMASIILISYPDRKKKVVPTQNTSKTAGINLLFTAIIFLGTGFNDSALKTFRTEFEGQIPDADFAIMIFFTAAVFGFLAVGYRFIMRKSKFEWRNVLWGLIIGVPNFFSIWALTKALGEMEGTQFFPLNNILQLAMASLIGIAFYRESFSRVNFIGLVTTMAAIWLLV